MLRAPVGIVDNKQSQVGNVSEGMEIQGVSQKDTVEIL